MHIAYQIPRFHSTPKNNVGRQRRAYQATANKLPTKRCFDAMRMVRMDFSLANAQSFYNSYCRMHLIDSSLSNIANSAISSYAQPVTPRRIRTGTGTYPGSPAIFKKRH
jgi:hypothetical protein